MRPGGWPVLQEGYALLFPHPQVKTEISVESKHQTLQGLTFPLQPAAQRALQQLKQRTISYIQLVGACPAPGTPGRSLLGRTVYGCVPAPFPPVCALQLPRVLVERTVPRPFPGPTWSCSPHAGDTRRSPALPSPCSCPGTSVRHICP